MKHLYLLYSFLFIPVFLFANPHGLEFIPNKGQWDGPFQYKARTDRGSVFLQQDGITYLVDDPSNGDNMDAYHHGIITKPPILKFQAYKVTFLNCNKNPQIIPSKPENTVLNYFLGNDSSRWVSGLHPYYAIDYKQFI